MSSREKAIEQLKKQMQAQRQRLDPRLLEIAGKAAALQQEGRAKKDMIPYDREAAAEAVALFLQGHGDRQNFEQRLKALLKEKE